ncbi:hypothetical protein [Magnetovibrio sp.]|uniref:hypothetical protein n=1 Tax=Magnetovibrio sp. TaxID=2024836 RepID=UPI002F9284E9
MSLTLEPLARPFSLPHVAQQKSAQASEAELSGDRIKDYIIERMTARLKGYDAEGLDMQMLSLGLTPAFGGADKNAFRSSTSNLSSLLNMHFDLNTLQMLNRT